MAYPKYLLGKVATRRNLREAWKDISQSARPLSRGHSEQTIQDFLANSNQYLETIRTELLNGAYRFGKVRAVTIKKKGSRKRPLEIADVRDRIVQRAMTLRLEPFLIKQFKLNNPASYAYLQGRGVQSAIKQMLIFHRRGCGIVFEADIVNFFGTVEIDKLTQEMMFPVLPDESLNFLIEAALKREIGNRDDLPEEDWELFPDSATGLPQGGYLSPLVSNVYLSTFDHKMIAASFRLIRYADDFVVMCRSIEEAEDAYDLTREILEGELGLKLHERDDDSPTARTRIVRPTQTPIQFLGIQFNGSRIWPASDKRQKLSYKLDRIRHSSANVIDLLTSTRNLIQGWIAAYGFTDIEVASIDREVDKLLWRTLSRLGWKLKARNPMRELTSEQRGNSGIRLASEYLEDVRSRLSDEALFAKYWTIENH